MDAIILAGGLGTRLRSVVSEVPKCMAPICEKPFLHYLLSYLSRFSNVKRIILSLGYKSEVVTDWIEAHKPFDFKYIYSIENKQLGTGGAIKKALTFTQSENVLILNGDTFFDVDLNLFVQQYKKNNSLITIALKSMIDFERYGNVEIDEKGIIIAFKEKAYCYEGQINGGVYILNTVNTNEIMNRLPEKFSFETEFLKPQIKNENIYGFIHNGYFIDIGIPDDYAKAIKDFI
jgi:D-glycero-alpha-D-manno-heptose 1-phosphate guanylyltransferase